MGTRPHLTYIRRPEVGSHWPRNGFQLSKLNNIPAVTKKEMVHAWIGGQICNNRCHYCGGGSGNHLCYGSFTLTVRTLIRIPNQMATLYCVEHFTLHRLRLGSLLPISVQDRNPNPSPYQSPSPAM